MIGIPEVWVGIDPGPAWTGIIARRGSECLGFQVLRNERPAKGHGVPLIYLQTIAGHARDFIRLADRVHSTIAAVALENATPPTGFSGGKKRFVDPRDTLGLGVMVGAMLMAFPQAHVVEPNKHGYGPLVGYPADLITAGERRGGLNRAAPQNSQLRHARSAWDVTLTAAAQHVRSLR